MAKNQVQEFVNKHRTKLDIHNNSPEQIFQSNFWSELQQSWNKDPTMVGFLNVHLHVVKN